MALSVGAAYPIDRFYVGSKKDNSSSYKSGFKLTLTESGAGYVKVKLNFPTSSGDKTWGSYQYAMGNGWVTATNGKVIKLTSDKTLKLRAKVSYYEIKKKLNISDWSWMGNKQSNGNLLWGDPLQVLKPNVKHTAKPIWSDWIRPLKGTGLDPNKWQYIEGTYDWANSGTSKINCEFYGWTKGLVKSDKGKVNNYSRYITYDVRSKNKVSITLTAEYDVDNIPEPANIRIYDKKRPITGSTSKMPYKRIPEYDSEEEESIYRRTSPVQVTWYTETSKFNYTVSNMYFTPAGGSKQPFTIVNNQTLTDYGTYTLNVKESSKDNSSVYYTTKAKIIIQKNVNGGFSIHDEFNDNEEIFDGEPYIRNTSVKPFWMQNPDFNYTVTNATFTDIRGNTRPYSIANAVVLKDYGEYNFTVTEKVKPGVSVDAVDSTIINVTIIIEDTVPPPKLVIYDYREQHIIYDDRLQVFTNNRYPTVKVPDGCVLESFYINDAPRSLASECSENGVYGVAATIRKLSNDITTTATGIFEIDNLPPKPPIIDIGNSEKYQGNTYGIMRTATTVPINVSVENLEYDVLNDAELLRKPQLYSNWSQVATFNGEKVYINNGSGRSVYKIKARSYKPRNGLYSDYTIVQAYKKEKLNWTITLTPDTLTYRTFASVNILNDPFYKYMYKIDNNAWQWYREPVRIYNNGVFQFKSLDGDDDYESNVAYKLVDIIDTNPPPDPKIGNVEDGGVYDTPVTPILLPDK